jgi:hypothetical protein
MFFLPLGVTVPLSLLPSLLMSIRYTISIVFSKLSLHVHRVWAMYTANRTLLVFLLVYLAAQTAVGLWQYTVKGATPAPLPLDNYEYHCELLVHSLTDRFTMFKQFAFIFRPKECTSAFLHLHFQRH